MQRQAMKPYIMDGHSGYNKIKMYPEDEEMIEFHSPEGVFYY